MPSAKVLEQKKAVVEALADKMSRAASGVLVKYEGITVDEDTGDRKVIIGDYDLQDFRSVVNRYGTDWDQAPTLFDEVE